MRTKTRDTFTTIRTEGALLPPDLLQAIAEGDGSVEGLRSEDYHYGGERLNEVINRAWNAVSSAWSSFQRARDTLPVSDLGTTITRERWLLPLFRELDYGRLETARADEIDGKSYAISHRYRHNVPVHLVSYKVDLDSQPAQPASGVSQPVGRPPVGLSLQRPQSAHSA